MFVVVSVQIIFLTLSFFFLPRLRPLSFPAQVSFVFGPRAFWPEGQPPRHLWPSTYVRGRCSSASLSVGAPANSWAVSGGGRRYGRLVDGYDTTISGGSLVFVLVLVLLLAVVVVVLLAVGVMILLLLAVVGQGLELGLAGTGAS